MCKIKLRCDMKRNILNKLIAWKDDIDRKPLIIKGARQVGKTWIMKEFGSTFKDGYVYFNFDEEPLLASIFKDTKNPAIIIDKLSLLKNKKISPDNTLIIFDEIQECPDALNSLKYFNENAKEYHIVAAGSLLGTLLAKPKSYPVGQVNTLNLDPLTFDEFLCAVDESLYSYYLSIKKDQLIDDIFHNRLLEVFSTYLIVGGMPECVSSWITYKDPEKIRRIQKEIIELYENDFSKHNGNVNTGRILLVFRSIVSQLAKENKKFVYGAVRSGARAREFEEAIEWLVSAGMINRVVNISKIEYPLNAFDILDQFKLYFFDTGLLKNMAGLDNGEILLDTAYQFKGPLIENYVLQQIKNEFTVPPHYYSNKNEELDFLIQDKTNIIPIEVKAGNNKKATSFKKYIKEKNPTVAIRYSTMGYRKDGEITNIPLYLVSKTKELI